MIARLPGLNRSLWYDEVSYSTNHLTPTFHALSIFLSTNISAPIYRCFMFFYNKMIPNEDILVRLPSLFFGVLSILLLYRIANRFQTRFSPEIAAICLCFSPSLVWYHGEATHYSMTMFFLLCCTWYLYEIEAEGPSAKQTSKSALLFLSFSFLMCMTHFYAMAFLVPFSLISLRFKGSARRVALLSLALTTSLTLGYIGIKIYWGSQAFTMSFLRDLNLIELPMLILNWYTHGNTIWTYPPTSPPNLLKEYNTHPSLFFIHLSFLVLILNAITKLGRREKREYYFDLVCLSFTVPGALFLLYLFGVQGLYLERYTLLSLPFFLTLVALSAQDFARPRARFALTTILLATVIIGYGCLLKKPFQWTVYKHNSDWKSVATKYSNIRSNDPIILMATAPSVALEYYLRKVNSTVVFQSFPSKKAKYQLFKKKDRDVHLVKNKTWAGDFPTAKRALRSHPEYQYERTYEFDGVKIEVYKTKLIKKQIASHKT